MELDLSAQPPIAQKTAGFARQGYQIALTWLLSPAASNPGVHVKPEPPDVELRGSGDSGIDFEVEFWADGIDDGKKNYAPDVLFLVWNAIKSRDISTPYPHRVVASRNAPAEE